MIGSQIIARFRLQVDDSSELSSQEELDLLNQVYTDLCIDRPWYWLRSATPVNQIMTTDTNGILCSVLPANFSAIIPMKYNKEVIFVGTARRIYRVIPYAIKEDYRDMDGFCYIDTVNGAIYFTKAPVNTEIVSYDYTIIPLALTLTTSPIMPFNHIALAYAMAFNWNPIEQSNKLTSYRTENMVYYNSKLLDLQLDDAENKIVYN